MIRAPVLAFACACAAAQEPGPGHAFVEAAAVPAECYVQQEVRVRLRLGIDRDFLRDHVVQPFHRPLDVPLQAEAPWLRELQGALLAERPEPRGPTLLLHAALVRADRREDLLVAGRQTAVLELERRLFPLAPGELVLEAPALRFTWSSRFREDFVRGRVAEDPREHALRGSPVVLRVLPLPDAGRPEGFTGAVGRFAASAEADPRELPAGATLRLSLRVQGEGNLELFEPPRPRPDGFHVQGFTEARQPGTRTFAYELVPLRTSLREVPALPFPFFDPIARAYRTVHTQAIPLVVTPPSEGTRVPAPPATERVPGESDIFGLKPATERGATAVRDLPAVPVAAALLLPWLLACALLAWRSARSLYDPARARALGAVTEFRAGIGRPDADAEALLAAFLASRLRIPAAAVVGPDLHARLVRAGAPGELAQRAAGLLEGLAAARYGGKARDDGATAARAVVEELEAAFRAREQAR